ncbi:MAG TPA: prenyltransferase/squalene oxidase repeat-containing protein [Tepidisphaeraceae bacterium]|nr:prenyltransferase/squalene oxidase repeat-containing protein [Tepidisphaeraceae bacterium]
MMFRKPASQRWLLAGALAIGGVLVPLPASPFSASPVRAAEDEPVRADARAAIDKGLAWLAHNQKPDGTFPQGDQAGTTAVPSLVVMAFIARGHVPGQGPYGEVLNKSIDYVLSSQQPDGLLSRHQGGNHVMYEHGISTVMLAEVYGMVDDARRPMIGKALAKSAAIIIKAQSAPKSNSDQLGGWRYQVNSPDSDMSVTGWQMMALRGAANCGAAIPKKVLEAGRQYVLRSVANDNSGGFGYQVHNGAKPTVTGTGVLMLELFRGMDPDLAPGEHPKQALAGGEYLIKHPPDNLQSEFYYYAVYYISQAVNQLGGKYWDSVYTKLRETLLAQAQPDGTFAAPNGGQERDAGPAYRTAMAILALAVPYRYLPIYQNDN